MLRNDKYIASHSGSAARRSRPSSIEPVANSEADRLLIEAFIDLFELAHARGITVKRMRDLLTIGIIRHLHGQGATRQQMMAISGFSLKTINRIMTRDITTDETDLVGRFVADWAENPGFPDSLPLEDPFGPSFQTLVDCHGHEFTSAAMLAVLEERGLVQVANGTVTLIENVE